MSIEMPYVIEFISSDTHELRQKVGKSLLYFLRALIFTLILFYQSNTCTWFKKLSNANNSFSQEAAVCLHSASPPNQHPETGNHFIDLFFVHRSFAHNSSKLELGEWTHDSWYSHSMDQFYYQQEKQTTEPQHYG